jgi:hypothetical protein
MPRPFRSTFAFCFLAAAAGVATRLALGDAQYFRLLHIPSHDLSEGLAFFATSMHSMRLFGDIAWWFPGSATGYAQYYQGFLSPLAPSYGHLAFIAWAECIALLGLAGIAIPEYLQYLVVTYVVLPFLAFASFAWFCTLVMRRRESVVLAMIAYVLSGIGLWDSAWFYFQEPFSLFFLLAATLALVNRPRAASLLVWLAAILVQLASLNYWTLYNLFFVAIVLGSHAATHSNRWRRAGRRIAVIAKRHRRTALAVAAAFAVTALAWTALIAMVVHEQSGAQTRAVYSAADALSRIQEVPRYTVELFDPSPERAAKAFPLLGPVHSARYVGITLLPLLFAGMLASFDRRARWLLASALLVLTVCLGWPPFVALWSAIPFMDRIQHVFYFYTHHWQVLLVLLAGTGLDHLLEPGSRRRKRVCAFLFALGVAASLAIFAWAALRSEKFPAGDLDLQALLQAALLLGLGSSLLLRTATAGLPRERRFGVVALLALSFLDLSAYFFNATRAEMKYTEQRYGPPPDAAVRAQLASPWGAPQPQHGFAAGLERFMPIANHFWPANVFLIPAAIPGAAFVAVHTYAVQAPPFLFYERARLLPGERMPASVTWQDLATMDRELHVERALPGAPMGDESARADDGFAYDWKRWTYNGFDIDLIAPRDGWLKVRQQYTPYWEARVDGRAADAVKANIIDMAVPISAGKHTLSLEFQPPSRRLYWPSAIVLQLAVVGFLLAALRLAKRHPQ